MLPDFRSEPLERASPVFTARAVVSGVADFFADAPALPVVDFTPFPADAGGADLSAGFGVDTGFADADDFAAAGVFEAIFDLSFGLACVGGALTEVF
ncbi:MAG: hypothetical protein ACK50J_03995 [Planctomyces sp.]